MNPPEEEAEADIAEEVNIAEEVDIVEEEVNIAEEEFNIAEEEFNIAEEEVNISEEEEEEEDDIGEIKVENIILRERFADLLVLCKKSEKLASQVIEEKKSSLHKANHQLLMTQHRLKTVESEAAELRSRNSRLRLKKDDFCRELQGQISDLNKVHAIDKEKLLKLEGELEVKDKKMAGLELHIENLIKDLEKANNELRVTTDKCKKLESEVEAQQSQKMVTQAQKEETCQELQVQVTKLAENEATVKARLLSLEEELKVKDKKLADQELHLENLSKDLSTANNELAVVKDRCKELESKLEEFQSRNSVLRLEEDRNCEELQHQGIAGVREAHLLAANTTFKRHCESSEEPPRKDFKIA